MNWGEFAAASTHGGGDADDDDGSGLPTVGVVAADDSRELPVSDHHMGNTPTLSRYDDDDDNINDGDGDDDDDDDEISCV